MSRFREITLVNGKVVSRSSWSLKEKIQEACRKLLARRGVNSMYPGETMMRKLVKEGRR